jgi:hypothetical protein
MLQYGPEQGYTSFRRCLAGFLSKETGHPVDAEELLITAGVVSASDEVSPCKCCSTSGGWATAVIRHLMLCKPTGWQQHCRLVCKCQSCSTSASGANACCRPQPPWLLQLVVYCFCTACAGVSHGLDLACRHLSSPGDHIIVEQPTYFLAGSILKQSGLQPVSQPAPSWKHVRRSCGRAYALPCQPASQPTASLLCSEGSNCF